MEPKRTDRELLGKGVQRMAIAMIFMFISPVIIHSAFKNQNHPYYIPILILGLIATAFTIFMAFRGLKTIINAFFGKK